jgi:hypothetical protein
VLEIAGVKPERLALEWASAAEASLYVELITKFTNQMKALGPLGGAEAIEPEALKRKLTAARAAVENVKLRTRFAKLALQLRDGNDFTPEVIQAAMAEKLNSVIMNEVGKQEEKAIGK